MAGTVKIDEFLLVGVRKLVGKKNEKVKYIHQKQFINTAVLKLLEEEEKGD